MQKISTIEKVLHKDLQPLFLKSTHDQSTSALLDPLPEFIDLLNSEITALSEADETPNTRIALLIMDGFLDILNFIHDYDFDLAMQRMIGLSENFFVKGEVKLGSREFPSFGDENL